MPKRILIIINTLNIGGAETFIMKVFRTIDRSKLVFDFLINDSAKGAYEDEVYQLGGVVYHGYFKVQHPFKNLYAMYSTVKKHCYKDVFLVTQHPIAFLDLAAVTLGGAKRRVVRSTNADCGGKLSHVLAAFSRPLLNFFTTVRVAPSKEAAKWLFGNSVVDKKGYTQLNNGLNLDLFAFNKASRDDFRTEFNLHGKTVIGHVGRFNHQKNHDFLIDIFAKYHETNPQSVLVLIGKGETEEHIRQKVKNIGLRDSVILTGVRSDIPRCLCGFDIFLFPSFYEGMPNTVIEAQVSGLPCVISDTITEDAKVTDLVQFETLQNEPVTWANRLKQIHLSKDRLEYKQLMQDNGYSIQDVAKNVMDLFSKKYSL